MAWFSDRFSTGSTSVGRAAVAFFVAPLVSSVLVVSAVMWAGMSQIPPGPNPSGLLQVLVAFLMGVMIGVITIGGLFTFIGMLLVGVPTWLLLRYTNNESGLAYTVVGLAGGVWLGPALGGHKWEAFPMEIAGGAGGALTLFLFWRLARRAVASS